MNEAAEKSPFAAAPNRVPWPPLLYVAAIAAALVLQALWPMSLLADVAAARLIGCIGLSVGAGLDGWAMLTLARARANILPHRAATRLVDFGPYHLSRNPIYLGNTIMTAAAGLAFANAWLVAAAIIAAVTVTQLAIRREEAHMAANFGAAWQSYAARVRRWL
jgi:protein-S-isoprenylcysteine O-methyltransferase Ste14